MKSHEEFMLVAVGGEGGAPRGGEVARGGAPPSKGGGAGLSDAPGIFKDVTQKSASMILLILRLAAGWIRYS